MEFELSPNFSSKIFLVDMTLCRVLLENERHYPWLLLIPRRPGLKRIMDLSFDDQVQLVRELDIAQKALWDAFRPTQLNVASIGNKTPQLHVHVIARFENDPAWPATVWDHPVRAPYESDELEQMKQLLREKL
ncbi:MAG: HIT family protein [Verrucomicrobia bacterium]|nr:HIT family protein [Verrucomicrobiota bacterium]